MENPVLKEKKDFRNYFVWIWIIIIILTPTIFYITNKEKNESSISERTISTETSNWNTAFTWGD